MTVTYYGTLTRRQVLNMLDGEILDQVELSFLKSLITDNGHRSWFEGLADLLTVYNRECHEKNFSVEWNEYYIYNSILNSIEGLWEFDHYNGDIDNFYVKVTTLLDNLLLSLCLYNEKGFVIGIPRIERYTIKGGIMLCLLNLQ